MIHWLFHFPAVFNTMTVSENGGMGYAPKWQFRWDKWCMPQPEPSHKPWTWCMSILASHGIPEKRMPNRWKIFKNTACFIIFQPLNPMPGIPETSPNHIGKNQEKQQENQVQHASAWLSHVQPAFRASTPSPGNLVKGTQDKEHSPGIRYVPMVFPQYWWWINPRVEIDKSWIPLWADSQRGQMVTNRKHIFKNHQIRQIQVTSTSTQLTRTPSLRAWPPCRELDVWLPKWSCCPWPLGVVQTFQTVLPAAAARNLPVLSSQPWSSSSCQKAICYQLLSGRKKRGCLEAALAVGVFHMNPSKNHVLIRNTNPMGFVLELQIVD